MTLFLSHRLYGERPYTHFEAYEAQPGWWFIEVSSWTLEIDDQPLPARLWVYSAAIITTLLLVPPPFFP